MGEFLSLCWMGLKRAWLGAFMDVWFSWARDCFSRLSMVIVIDLFMEVLALGEMQCCRWGLKRLAMSSVRSFVKFSRVWSFSMMDEIYLRDHWALAMVFSSIMATISA